ncbi:MAG: PhnD/SsuA/transferrin family substrate-binding protein [Campylobacterales bacterium]|nr:PhnD/SsuA/transferrin family substrate-binding protein [Campylobacterales bacterium]
MSEYEPIATYLSKELNVTVVIKPLTQEELEDELNKGTLDIVATNPTHYLSLQKQHKTTGAIATLVKQHNHIYTANLGGVILTHSNRADIASLKDLKGKNIAIPGKKFLGGFLTQNYELLENGVDVSKDVTLLELGSHDRVVQAVVDGTVDAGFIRSGIYEELVEEGLLNPRDVSVVHEYMMDYFPLKVSTTLYPEWAIVAAKKLDVDIISKIAVALYGYVGEQKGNNVIVGFTIPGDYAEIDRLARALRIPPYEMAPDFTSKDIFQKYGNNISAIVIVIVLFIGALWSLYQKARREKMYAQSILNAAPNPIIIRNEQTIVSANTAFLELVQYDSLEAFKKEHNSISDFFEDGETDEYLRARMYDQSWIEYILSNPQTELKAKVNVGEKVKLYRVKASLLESKGDTYRVIVTFDDISLLVAQLTTDSLTKVPNKMHFDLMFKYALNIHKREAKPLSLIFFDVDYFKRVNDMYGHLVGDKILYDMAQLVKASLRKTDTVARWGGEEFVVLLPNTSLADAKNLAENLRVKIESKLFEDVGHLTSSFGVSEYLEGEKSTEFLERVDKLLYEAKANGRNLVIAR